MASIHAIDESQILRMRRAGISNPKIANYLDVPRSTIERIVREAATVQATRPSRCNRDSWTDERVDLLKQYWKDGLTASQIAKRLGGVSRSAVIGKVYRLNLPGRLTNKRVYDRAPRINQKQSKKRAKPRLVPPPFNKMQPHDPGYTELKTNDIATVSCVADLEPHHCRWPVGDPRNDFDGFCGAEKFAGSSYCEHHAYRAKATPHQISAIRQHEDNPDKKNKWLAAVKAANLMIKKCERAEDLPG